MIFFESFFSAVKSIYSYKMRSLLTMLGIIIGISAVITITSLGTGVHAAIYDELGSFNTSAIQVFPRNMRGNQITFEDMEALRRVPNVYQVSGITEINGQQVRLRNPALTRRGIVYALDQYYGAIENINMLYGRFLIEQDIANYARVAVITPEVSLEVFGVVNSVGQRLHTEGSMGRVTLTVIGVLDIEPSGVGAQTPLNMALLIMPLSTAGFLTNNPRTTDFLAVSVLNPDFSVATAEQVSRFLNIRHDRDDAFYAMSMATVLEGLDAVFVGVTGFVAFVAGISLFVGGVGVMNIMMVTVTERTREIGIKKSLGATGSIIRLQFVLEAVFLTSLGGIIGMVLGFLGATLLGNIISSVSPMEISASIDLTVVVLAISISMLVGLIFGVYPAAKAAKLDPVESLRYE